MSRTLPVLVAVVADLAGVALLFLLAPPLAARLADFGFVNSLILGVFIVFFSLAVWALHKLHDDERFPGPAFLVAGLENRTVLAVFGVIFALAYALVTAYATGFLDSVAAMNRTILDEPSATLYLLLTPASWFALSLLYMLVLSRPTGPTVPARTPLFHLVSLLALLGVNLMAVVFTAFFQALAARFMPGPGDFITGPLIFLLFLILFLPPRAIHLVKTGQPLSVLTFLFMLAFFTAVTGY